MLAEPEERCAPLARALREPLAGTAPSTARWLCLEHPEPWPRDITRHPDQAIRDFLARAADTGFRPLLVRPPGSATGGVRRILLCDTDPDAPTSELRTVTGASELAELPLPEPGRRLAGAPSGGSSPTGVQLLVCTHTERDPCCGRDGRELVAELGAARVPDVWECSHLGGHRFAPTALVLPTGYVYGRLDRERAVSVLAAAAAGAVTTDGCRGRSTWSAAGQVAELAVREATGLLAAAALTVHPDDVDGRVRVDERDGLRWTVEVSTVELDEVRPASCGSRPTLMVPLRAGPVRALPPARQPATRHHTE